MLHNRFIYSLPEKASWQKIITLRTQTKANITLRNCQQHALHAIILRHLFKTISARHHRKSARIKTKLTHKICCLKTCDITDDSPEINTELPIIVGYRKTTLKWKFHTEMGLHISLRLTLKMNTHLYLTGSIDSYRPWKHSTLNA